MEDSGKTKDSEKDALLGLFWKLSNPDDNVRISASEKIVASLLASEEQHKSTKTQDESKEDFPWCSEVKYAISRLMQGLASERKASRLGFSCALTHLLAKLEIIEDNNIQALLKILDEKLKSSKEKGAEKGALLGNVFAYLTVVHSCKLDEAPTSVKIIFEGLMKLSKLKSYLRPVCMHGVAELVKKVPNSIFDKVMWEKLSEIFSAGWESCDAEVFQLLEICCKHQADTCGKNFLKANNWIAQKSKKVELIGPHSYKYLGQMLPATTSCHPRIHPLCYEVIDSVVKLDLEIFKKFWKETIETGLLDSSAERKYLALKLSIHVLPMLNNEKILFVWSTKIVTTLMYIFSNKTNPLHNVCKSEIIDELCEKLKDEKVTSKQQMTLLFQFLTSPAGLFLDGNTNTRCIAALSGSLKLEALQDYIKWLRSVFTTGKLSHEGIKEVSLDTARRWSVSQLSQLVRNHRLPREDDWILSTIKFLFIHYHFTIDLKKIKKAPEFKDMNDSFVAISDKTREHLKNCLEPALNAINSAPTLRKDVKEAKFHGTASDGEFWISKLINFTNTLLNKYKLNLVSSMDDKSLEMWNEMVEKSVSISRIEESDKSRVSEGTALRLLLAHVGIKLINCSEDEITSTQEVLSDLFQVVNERFSEDETMEQTSKDEDVNWVEIVIETILNMLSQNSRSIRSVADQVFKLLSTQLTRRGLNLILDVLDPLRSKEVMQYKDEEDMDDEESEDDAMEDDDDEESSDSDDSAFDDADVSDEAGEDSKFRKKVKEALGEAAPSSDEEDNAEKMENKDESDDDSGPEMDDEAMMRIDSVLAEVFRQKKMTKRKLQEDSHKQLLVFQLRCLDLIEIMAGRKQLQDPGDSESDSLILEAVRPLLVAIQHASKKATDMTLAEKASVLLRVKICKMKRYPKNLSKDTILRCHDDVEAIMGVAYKAPSVFICQLASDCCLFLLKVLAGNAQDDSKHGAVDIDRIVKLYKDALENFMAHRESHLQPCIIQDFILRFPSLAADLASDLLKYVKDGVQVYRRSRACYMLYELLKNSASREKCKNILYQVTSVTNELVERASDSGNIKMKYFVELMKLYHQAIVVLQSMDKLKSLNKKVLTEPLEKFLEMPEVSKSQELTSWTWKVLRGFGVDKDASKVSKKKGRKRKKSNSESEKPSETDEQTKKVEVMETDASKVESKKEIKARVMKEKKERKKKKSNEDEKEKKEKKKKKTKSKDKNKKKESNDDGTPKITMQKKKKKQKQEPVIAEKA